MNQTLNGLSQGRSIRLDNPRQAPCPSGPVSARRAFGVLVTVALILLPSLCLHAEQKEVADLSAFFRDYLGEGAKKEKFEFAVISDTHICGQEGKAKAFRALLERIKAVSTPDFVVIVGDLTEGKKEHFQELFTLFREVLGDKVKLLPTLGNHDRGFPGLMDGLFDVRCSGSAMAGNYSVDYGRFHFTILTCVYNGGRYPGEGNVDFLANDFKAHASRPTLLFQHIPVISTIPNDAYLTNLGADRYEALEFLKGFPSVKAVVSGHTHTFFACRYYDKVFLSAGSGHSLAGDAWINGWWLFKADGEKIQTFLEPGNRKLADLSDWQEKIPPFKTPMSGLERKQGWVEIPLFTETCEISPTLGNSANVTGAVDDVAPVAGQKMLVSTEKDRFPAQFRKLKYPLARSYEAYDALLTYGDFELKKGDRLSYWIYVPPGVDAGPVGVIIPGIDFSGLKGLDGLAAILDLKQAGLSPGNWFYREIPLGDSAGWYSATQFAGPGSFQPAAGLKPFKIFLDEVRILRGEPATEPNREAPAVTGLKAAQAAAAGVVLEWAPAPKAHHYQIFRAEGGAGRLIGTSAEPRFRDLTVEGKKDYKYVVTAVSREAGTSAPAAISVTTPD